MNRLILQAHFPIPLNKRLFWLGHIDIVRIIFSPAYAITASGVTVIRLDATITIVKVAFAMIELIITYPISKVNVGALGYKLIFSFGLETIKANDEIGRYSNDA